MACEHQTVGMCNPCRRAYEKTRRQGLRASSATPTGRVPYKRKKTVVVDGAKLCDARLAAGLSVEKVARMLGDGVNPSSISRWEQGKLRPTAERVLKLIALYKKADFVDEGSL